MTLRKILVAVDDSEGSAGAVRFATAWAAPIGAEVLAVHALGLLADIGHHQVPAQTHRDEVAAMVEGWAAPLAEAGVTHRCLLVDGNPVQALLAVAEREAADAIVVGKRARAGVAGLQLGSTSQQLVQHSPVPVVVVPERT